jgi:uncharacterized membrane protein
MERDVMQVLAYRRGSAEFDRGVSFFDAVYGFAITLLITTVHPPGPKAWSSVATLLRSNVGSELFGFVLSFLVIALFWRYNYRLIGTMSGMSPRIIASNIACVFFIILIPFTTQAMNAAALTDLPLPTALYATNIAFASLSQATMYQIARSSGLVPAAASRRGRVIGWIQDLALPVVFLASIPIAFLAGSHIAQDSWASLVILMPVLGRVSQRVNGPLVPIKEDPAE